MIVYVATHRASGRRYVGYTEQTLARRRKRHESRARGKSQYHFHRALRKYGAAAFDWRVFCTCVSFAAMLQTEMRVIALFLSNDPQYGFNRTHGGDASPMSNPLVRDEMSEIMRGRKFSQEHLDNLRAARRARVMTPAELDKLAIAREKSVLARSKR